MIGPWEILALLLVFFCFILFFRNQAKRICPKCGFMIRAYSHQCPECHFVFPKNG